MAYVYLFNPCELSEELVEQLTLLGVNVELEEEHEIYRVLWHCEYEAEKTLKDFGLSDAYFDSWYED